MSRTSFLVRLDRAAAAVETAFLALSLGGAALISFVLIVGRNVASVSYNSLEEIAVYLVIWMVFVGMAAADRTRTNISIDILMHVLPSSAARGLRRIADGLTAILALVLAWASLDAVLFSRMINERAVSSLEVKIWPIMAVIPAAFVLVALRAAIRTVRPGEEPTVLESAH